jgi:hypothetical protein
MPVILIFVANVKRRLCSWQSREDKLLQSFGWETSKGKVAWERHVNADIIPKLILKNHETLMRPGTFRNRTGTGFGF